MALFHNALKVSSRVMHMLSGVAIIAIVIVTCLDVIMRRTGMLIDFPFEVVCALAGIVVAFALPETSLTGTHVLVDYLKLKLSPDHYRVTYLITRVLGIGLFLVVGWNAVMLGNHLKDVRQCSAVLQIPEFLFPYFLAAGCFVTCVVLFSQMLQPMEEKQK